MHIKTLIALISAIPCTIATQIMKYVYQDWEYAKWIGIAILVDTLVSLIKHWIMKDVSSEEFWNKFSKKIFVYIILLILSNLLANYTVNGHIVNIPSYLVKAGDEIEIKEKAKSSERYKQILEVTGGRSVPQWLDADQENLKGTVKELPRREDIDVPVDEMLIVELYSK